MTAVLAFLVGAIVMVLGFFMGALMATAKVSDLQAENMALRNALHGEMDAEDLIDRFREQIDGLGVEDDDDNDY